MIKKYSFVFVFYIFNFVLWSQSTDFWRGIEPLFEEGLDLFDKKIYASAHEKMREVQDKYPLESGELQAHISYYLALSSDRLFNKDAEFYCQDFLKLYPTYPKIEDIRLALAHIFFRKKEYERALILYQEIEIKNLAKDQQSSYRFHRAYAALENQDLTGAKNDFYQLIEPQDSIYYAQALYYYAYILYRQGYTQEALQKFKILESQPEFAQAVPFQIYQIYLERRQYQEALQYLEKTEVLTQAKTSPVVMEGAITAALMLKDYKKAFKFLTEYEEATGGLSAEHYFLKGTIYQKNKDYQKALETYEKVIIAESENLAQRLYYHRGVCYLKLKNVNAAQEAFQLAYQKGEDEKIAENALLNRAKLMYENPKLGYIDDVETALATFIEKYPNSKYLNDAYSLLAFFYLNSNNYAQAQKSLEKIPKKNAQLNMAYQWVCYNYGIELFHQKDYTNALIQFEKVTNLEKSDPTVTALGFYQSGLTAIQLKNDLLAEKQFEIFKRSASAYGLEEFNLSNYHLGYIYYKNKKYTEAAKVFLIFVNDKKEKNKDKIADAYLRLGDVAYLLNEMDQALLYYQKSDNPKTQDYALLQQAVLQGEQGKTIEKEKILKDILERYPETIYKAEVLFELADVSRFLNKRQEAISFYKNFIDTYPFHPKITVAKVELALLYYKESQANLAAEELKKLLITSDLGEQFEISVALLEEIYVEWGKTEELKVWMEKNGLKYRSEQVENLAYENAKKQYFAKNYTKAVELFQRYLTEYAKPVHRFSALALLSESYLALKETKKALQNLEKIATEDQGSYKIPALKRLSEIYTEEKQIEKAVYYLQEELKINTDQNRIFDIRLWLAQYFFEQKKLDLAIEYAESAINQPKKEAVLEDLYILLARAWYQKKEPHKAFVYFENLENNKTKVANEALFYKAQIRFDEQDLQGAENYLQHLFEKKPAYRYWTAKGYLLMSQILIERREFEQAQLTLESLLNGYKADPKNPDDILILTQEKLNQVKRKQNKVEPKRVTEELQLNLDAEQAEKNKKLYE